MLLPGAWLARQDREELRDAIGPCGEVDWIAEQLELLDGHEGPFELCIDDTQDGTCLLGKWLDATEG